MSRRRRRAGGFTLSEILVALALAGVVSVSILILARGQLRAHEMNDQILRAQANVRAAIDYSESVLRRACGGLSSGALGLNVGGSVTQKLTNCVNFYDGATTNGGTFTANTSSAASTADAIEVVYPITAPTVLISAPNLGTTPVLTVANASNFSAGNLVLVTDNSGGALFKVQSVAGNVLTMNALSSPASSYLPTGVALAAGSQVFRAASVAIFLGTATPYASSHPDYTQSLMLDPDGMAGTTHDDADPLVDGVDDFQIAIGVDGNAGGAIDGNITESTSSPSTDEWIGNSASDTALALSPWNSTGLPQTRLIRATVLVRTLNSYPGQMPTLGYEDRTTYSLSGPAYPRYRPERITVAPRAWNLSN